MEYSLSKKVFFNTQDLNNHYIGWCLIGNYYIENEKILENKLESDNIIDMANICALSEPEKNFITIDGNSVIFNNSNNLRIIGKNNRSGIKIEDCMLVLLDYGIENINIEQKIIEVMGSDFQNEALLKEKKDISHIFFNSTSDILYKQYIDDNNKIINAIDYTKIMVGKLKVNLEGLEN